MRLRLAVFDMVGTTVHAGDEVPSSFRRALSSVGVKLSDAAVAGVRGRSKREAISDLLAADPATAGSAPELSRVVFERFQDSLRRAYRANAQPTPGAESVFEGFRGGGIDVVLTTGLDRDTAYLLVQSLGWDTLGLRGLITGDDVRRGRPAPDLIHAAMRLAGVVDPAAVLVVGDTVSDLEAAAAAGVGWSIGVLTGAHTRAQLEAHPHSAILETVGNLPRWLAEAGALMC